jgi:hypothetical protein
MEDLQRALQLVDGQAAAEAAAVDAVTAAQSVWEACRAGLERLAEVQRAEEARVRQAETELRQAQARLHRMTAAVQGLLGSSSAGRREARQ